MLLAKRLRDDPPLVKLEAELPRLRDTKIKQEISYIKEEPVNEDQDTDTEIEDDEEGQEVRKKVEEALELQIQFVRDEVPKRKFSGVEELQREVVDKLNAITSRLGIPHFFEHNGLEKPKYLSVKCRGCEHSSYLWFEKDILPTGETILQFVRPPYGINMHRNVNRHLPSKLKTHLRERVQSKSKFF